MQATQEPQDDLPLVLDTVVSYFNDHLQGQGVMLTCNQLAELAGLDPTGTYRALKRLEPTYVRLVEGWSRDPSGCSIAGVTDAARRAVGQWPESIPDQIAVQIADRIVAALLEAAEREPDEQKRSKLRAAAETLGSFGRDLLVNVAANVATKPISF
jgi:hypothetical protein